MQALGTLLGMLLMNAWRRRTRSVHSGFRRTITQAQLQDLRDQYRDEMEAKARHACEMLVSIGCTAVRVERDGTVHRYNGNGSC